MTIQNIENSNKKARRETIRLLALCAVLCVPLLGSVPVRNAANRNIPFLRHRINDDMATAIAQGNLKQVQLLVSDGAEINTTPPLSSPLMQALN